MTTKAHNFLLSLETVKDIPNLIDLIGGRFWSIDHVRFGSQVVKDVPEGIANAMQVVLDLDMIEKEDTTLDQLQAWRREAYSLQCRLDTVLCRISAAMKVDDTIAQVQEPRVPFIGGFASAGFVGKPMNTEPLLPGERLIPVDQWRVETPQEREELDRVARQLTAGMECATPQFLASLKPSTETI